MNYYVSILEALAFLVSLLSFKIKDTIFKWICGILFLTVINEWWITPAYAARFGSSSFPYNVFSLADMTAWSVIFFLIHKKKTYRTFIVAAYTICLAYSLVELFILKGWQEFHTDSFRVYNISVILFSLMFFFSKLREQYYDFLSDPYFWICSAVFLFHATLFVNLTTQASKAYWKLKNAEEFFYILQNTGNTLYYFLLTFSFLICYFKFSRRTQT